MEDLDEYIAEQEAEAKKQEYEYDIANDDQVLLWVDFPPREQAAVYAVADGFLQGWRAGEDVKHLFNVLPDEIATSHQRTQLLKIIKTFVCLSVSEQHKSLYERKPPKGCPPSIRLLRLQSIRGVSFKESLGLVCLVRPDGRVLQVEECSSV